jgi:hypothetical protein
MSRVDGDPPGGTGGRKGAIPVAGSLHWLNFSIASQSKRGEIGENSDCRFPATIQPYNAAIMTDRTAEFLEAATSRGPSLATARKGKRKATDSDGQDVWIQEATKVVSKMTRASSACCPSNSPPNRKDASILTARLEISSRSPHFSRRSGGLISTCRPPPRPPSKQVVVLWTCQRG